MISSIDLIKAGKLPEARKQLVEEVKSSPGDTGKRTLLFQVLAFYGEWDKAERHLDMIATQDSSRETGVQGFKNLLQGDRERLEVCDLKRRPSFVPKTPPYAVRYFLAWEKLTEKKVQEAEDLFREIEANHPALSGTVNGKPFTGFRDTDAFLSLFLEAFVHERYVWIPFEAIRELIISPPKTLFDLLWTSARITSWKGLTLNCYLPVLYPNSFLHEDDRVKLGRMTDWTPLGGPYAKGMGQHVFEIGDTDMAVLEIQEILFEPFDTGEDNEARN